MYLTFILSLDLHVLVIKAHRGCITEDYDDDDNNNNNSHIACSLQRAMMQVPLIITSNI